MLPKHGGMPLGLSGEEAVLPASQVGTCHPLALGHSSEGPIFVATTLEVVGRVVNGPPSVVVLVVVTTVEVIVISTRHTYTLALI